MNELIDKVSNWAPNRWLMSGGYCLMLLSIVSGITGVEMVDEMRVAGFIGGFSLVCLGAWYAREARRYEALEAADRRSTQRSAIPSSELSEQFVDQIKGPITLAEADNYPLVEHDAKKTKPQLQATVKRLRLRDAARSGLEIYFSDGLYVPRRSADSTVFTEG